MTEAKKPTKIEALTNKIATLEGQLTTLRAELTTLQAAEQAAAQVLAARKAIDEDGLAVDTAVVFDYGRSTNRKIGLTGTVVAFRAAQGELPAAYKIETGEGIDLTVLTVPARDVRLPVAEAPAEQTEG